MCAVVVLLLLLRWWWFPLSLSVLIPPHSRGKNIQSVEISLKRSPSEVSNWCDADAMIWCDTDAMIIHPAKRKSIVITTRQRHQLSSLHIQLTLEKAHIEQVREHLVLGVTIANEMKWQAHLNNP